MAGWRVGVATIARVEEFTSPGFPPSLQFPDFDPAIYDAFPELRDLDPLDPETGRTFASIHTWLLRIGDDVVLVDTASGNAKERTDPKFERFHMLDTDYLGALAAAGIRPEDVTLVVNTHMHVDHSGWNTTLVDGEWVPTFPNARYVFGRREYQNWQADGVTARAQPEGVPVIKDSIDPIVAAGLVDWVDNGDEIRPGVTFHAAPGHTSGQLVMRVESEGATAVFTADCMHRALQVFDPTLNCFLCENNLVAPITRAHLLADCADREALIFPAHFGAPHAGYVKRRDDGGFRFVPAAPQPLSATPMNGTTQ